jgi:hypothetical protein
MEKEGVKYLLRREEHKQVNFKLVVKCGEFDGIMKFDDGRL